MKTQNRFFRLVVLVILTIGLTSCSKDEVVPPVQIVDTDKDGIADPDDNCPNQVGPVSNQGCPENTGGEGQITEDDGITEEDLETYKGDIGMVLDTRELAKKGYVPVKAQLDVKGTISDYSKTIDVDPYSFMGQIKLPVEDLSVADFETLKNGVEVITKLFDSNGTEIFTQTFTSVLFKSDPIPTRCTNELPDLNTDVNLIANTPYYIQVVEYKNNQVTPQHSAAFRRIVSPNIAATPDFNNMVSTTSTIDFTGDEDNSSFFFESIEGKPNHFNIRHEASGTYLKRIPMVIQNTYEDLGYHGIKVGFEKTDKLNQQFVLHKVDNGVYRMTDAYYVPIEVSSGVGFTVGHEEGTELFVRLVPMSIDWEVQQIETHYLEPLLPSAQNGFTYNSALINCGSGPLQQSIGKTETFTTNTTVGWEESFSFMSSTTSSYSVTIGLEVEGKFFGNGAKYSAEATGSSDYTTQSATENTNWNEVAQSTTKSFFETRAITIPAKSAVVAYDAFQSYDNIKVNMVQRIQIKGMNQVNNQTLTGDEIATQFHFNGFEGVITYIGPDYTEVTLRAVATLDKIFEFKSDIQEIDANCSN